MTTFNLSLTDISYDDKYKLNQASVSQLVRGMQEMGNRLGEPTNEYQKHLYPTIKTLCENIVVEFSKLLNAHNEIDKDIRKYNLHGYNGKIRKPVSIRGVKHGVIYKYANFGDYTKCITQRLTYLMERELPERYITNVAEGDAYKQLQSEIHDFMKFMKEHIEPSWSNAVLNARNAGGNLVEENLQKRVQQKIKSQEKKTYKKKQLNGKITIKSVKPKIVIKQKKTNSKLATKEFSSN